MGTNIPPKVSVVMSVFNGEKYLREAMDSILTQTFTDFEFIIINDGSTDRTREILESYVDPRIRLYHQQNMGLTKSLNKGLSFAKGDYLARQDGDDISYPERLSYQVNFLDSNKNIGLIGTFASFINSKGEEFNIWKPPWEHEGIKKHLMITNCFCHGSVMFRKDCLDTVGYYREKFKYSQDYDLWIRISEQYRVANINEILYKNRRSSSTITRKRLPLQLNFHLLAIELAKERMGKGTDSLHEINDNIEMCLKKKFRLNKSEINKFKSCIYMQQFVESFKTKNYYSGIIFWVKAFIFEARKYKIELLLRKIID